MRQYYQEFPSRVSHKLKYYQEFVRRAFYSSAGKLPFSSTYYQEAIAV
jgi:hypothetical protein